jgi:hypothetical protein
MVVHSCLSHLCLSHIQSFFSKRGGHKVSCDRQHSVLLPPSLCDMKAGSSGQADNGHKLCIECKVNSGKSDGTSYRCPGCNSLKSRITRLSTKGGEQQAAAFKTLTKEEKLEFFAKNRTTMGDDLSAAVQDVISRVLQTTEETEFKGTGEFMDEDDIREKYAKKPKQADAIIKNSRSMFDTLREVQVYEDMKYSSKVSQTEKMETSTGQSSTHDRYVKGKTQKKSTVPAIKQETAGEAMDLSEAQIKTLGQLVADIVETNNLLDAEIVSIETKEVKEFMVQASIQQAEACGFKLKEFVASVGVAVDSSTGDFKELKSQHRELKTAGKEQVRRLKAQVKAASSLKIELLTPKIAKGTKRKEVEVKEQP